MGQEIHDFVPSSCGLLALGEPTHREPGFASLRNELFADLVAAGFRSIALESDRVAALVVHDYVRDGIGSLDEAMRTGFSHGFGDLDANRQLVAWIRAHNERVPPEDRVAFHGFDGAMETMSAPSPRRYLECARDYLDFDLDFTDVVGEDEQWSRTEAVLDPAVSIGDTAQARQLRVLADDLLSTLYTRAPERIATTSHAEWRRAAIHLTTALGLLRYHRQAAQRLEDADRWSRLSATRDALMAQNLLDIRTEEARRGPTLVCAHNLHLRRNASHLRMGPMDLTWSGAGEIVATLLGDQYSVLLGSLGSSPTIGLGDPPTGTYEHALQDRIPTWGLTRAETIEAAHTRADITPEQGYFPLDPDTVHGADAILHLNTGAATSPPVG
ncbi:erythromycin esterase family protein [Nocardia mangyaensis]|uniref:erythromycin esterase family protein n=1 Tax=Nocardia mangyaensis TaxID=2213200 RepID=UPI002674481F|nr:erythromycin esterase family protein [Nocardia mangyaensis]MDO3649523.1 erythromycin esterase family protein [Nocardia mangyaensis]